MNLSVEVIRYCEKFKGCLSALSEPTNFLGRQREVDCLSEVLLKTRMKNAILIGEAGVGKTVIVQKAASILKPKYVFLNLSLMGCVAGTTLRGEFEGKVQGIIEGVAIYNRSHRDRPIVFFIDEIHNMYRAGAVEGGTLDFSNMLKPYLTEGDIIIIGATTLNEYRETIFRDAALGRRFTPIYIPEIKDEDTLKVLRLFCKTKIKEDTLKYIVEQSKTLQGQGYRNPDCSIEIADRAMAHFKYCGEVPSVEVVDSIISTMAIPLGIFPNSPRI